jgi:hypothetical protein
MRFDRIANGVVTELNYSSDPDAEWAFLRYLLRDKDCRVAGAFLKGAQDIGMR